IWSSERARLIFKLRNRTVDYAVSEKFDEWFPTVRSQTIFLTAYLRSNRHKPFKKIDRETGEILE
ncbi:hypothetical protein ABWR62_12745, partial [Enterococcus faecium]